MNSFSKYPFLFLIGLALTISSCRSVDEMAINKISEILSSDSGAGVFTRDDDPQFVADALPFAMKMYEMLIEMNPDDVDLRLAAGKTFVMYANAFLQTPAGMMPDEDWEEQEILLYRARNMYLRGRDYVLSAMALNHENFQELLESDPDALMEQMTADDATALYWAAAGWLGAFSCNPFDMELASRIHLPVAFLFRGLELDETVERGGAHELLITIWSSIPRGIIEKSLLTAPGTVGVFEKVYYKEAGVGEDEESRARFHLKRALELSGEYNPSPYVTFAAGFPVKQQNYDEFESLLEKALAIEPEDDPENELIIHITRRKAAWYLEHREDYFLLDF